MNPSKKRFLFSGTLAVAMFLSLPLAAQEWAGSGRVKGSVKAEDGTPVKDAKVYFKLVSDPDRGPEPFITNKKGKFSFLGLRGGTWIVKVKADGYEEWIKSDVEVYSTGVTDNIDAVLTPLPPEVLQAQKRFKAQERLDKAKDLAAAGKVDEAVAQYEAALGEVAEQDYPVILANLGNLYLANGKVVEAKSTFERAVAIDPDHAPCLEGLTAIVAAEGDFARAEELLARLPDSTPVHPNTTINIGMAHYNKGEMEPARHFLDRTVRDHPDVAVAYYFRGLIALSQDDRDTARNDFERFIEMAPDDPKAAEAEEYLGYLVPTE